VRHSLRTINPVPKLICILLVGLALACAKPASASPITIGAWEQFGFGVAGDPAQGCDPDDPASFFCFGSSSTPTSFLSAPPWTFLAPASGASLTVTDVFEAGDRFEIFDFGSSLGLTSLPVGSDDCGDDPVVCAATAGVSHRVFSLASGSHSLTIIPTLSPGELGAGYLRVDAQTSPVPEPNIGILAGIGLVTMCLLRFGLRRISGAARQ